MRESFLVSLDFISRRLERCLKNFPRNFPKELKNTLLKNEKTDKGWRVFLKPSPNLENKTQSYQFCLFSSRNNINGAGIILFDYRNNAHLPHLPDCSKIYPHRLDFLLKTSQPGYKISNRDVIAFYQRMENFLFRFRNLPFWVGNLPFCLCSSVWRCTTIYLRTRHSNHFSTEKIFKVSPTGWVIHPARVCPWGGRKFCYGSLLRQDHALVQSS